MKIIPGDKALRQCIPNTFANVEGEASLFEKLYPYLEQAEEWMAMNITSHEMINVIATKQDISPLRRIAAKIITAQAMKTAIPSLDLVLTPNGFGIVNTGNVVPASKDRVERLMVAMVNDRDIHIDAMLRRLPAEQQWLNTEQAKFFQATLFPTLSLCQRLAVRDNVYDTYLKLREKLIKIENVLAETYFSQELYEKFRQIVSTNAACSPVVAQVIRSIQSLELLLVSDMECHTQSFYDIVNTIRERPEVFPEWHNSKTAELYSPTVFINKKDSSGYWF